MKIYLVLLCMSLVSRFMVSLEVRIYQKKNFIRVKKPTFSEFVSNRCKDIVLIAMIFPYIFTFITILCFREEVFKKVGESIENSENFEEKIVDK